MIRVRVRLMVRVSVGDVVVRNAVGRKVGNHPDQVALSGCHGNQVNFKISISKKFLISP